MTHEGFEVIMPDDERSKMLNEILKLEEVIEKKKKEGADEELLDVLILRKRMLESKFRSSFKDADDSI